MTENNKFINKLRLMVFTIVFVTLLGVVPSQAQAKFHKKIFKVFTDPIITIGDVIEDKTGIDLDWADDIKHVSNEVKDETKKFFSSTEETVRNLRNIGLNIIETVELLIKAMNDSDEFPARLNNKQDLIDNPNIQLTLSIAYLNELIGNLENAPIPTKKKKDSDPPNNDYVQLEKPRISVDSARNIIVLESAGRAAGDFGKVRGSIKLDAIRIDLAPKVEQDNDRFFLNMYARVTYLDINDSPPVLDRYVANAIQHLVSKDEPITSIEITQLIRLNLDISIINQKREILLNVTQKGIFATDNGLLIQIKAEGNNE